MSDTWIRGFVEHPDSRFSYGKHRLSVLRGRTRNPDHLVALKFGFHDYKYISDVKEAYVDGEISELEMEAILEGAFERFEKPLVEVEV